ncbi:Hypothetical predicted protein [Olea europaea subsp. europaea]|uniref:Uncharacterized protein n=1 Tax=Olea europaea subsp. europaea TaxID=158383 RepID=A0A8S0TDF2_OLEEU|nr:Hypothetical predicted protein [Olea europaea subsp. europaea]
MSVVELKRVEERLSIEEEMPVVDFRRERKVEYGRKEYGRKNVDRRIVKSRRKNEHRGGNRVGERLNTEEKISVVESVRNVEDENGNASFRIVENRKKRENVSCRLFTNL